MASHTFKALLNAAVFPFAARLAHQTVLVPGLDQNIRVPERFYGEISSADFGVPQLIYCENVMPAGEGLISTSFVDVLPALPAAPAQFDQILQLRDFDENIVYLVPAMGVNYIYKQGSTGWAASATPPAPVSAAVSRAYVNGRTFVCYAGLGVYEYNATTGVLDKKTLTGITDAEVMYITQSSNYLIAASRLQVAWSSLVDPLDFTPSTSTGAGNNIPQDLKGPITAVWGVPGGFLIFTSRNCVAATYSTNVRAPFIFREVDNAGGVESYEQLTTETSSAKVYAWTTGGLQSVNLRAAEPLFPEVSDFLAGKYWEQWNPLTKQIVGARSAGDFRVKLAHVSSRYLVISYGRPFEQFEFALIHDLALKRWGKVRLPHVDATFFTYLPSGADRSYQQALDANEDYTDYADTAYADLIPRETLESTVKDSLVFMQADGRCVQLVMDYRDRESNAVMILGRYQMRRERAISLQTFQVDHVKSNWDLRVTAQATLDGAEDGVQIPGALIEATSRTRTYGFDFAARNFTLILEGTFEAKDLTLNCTDAGKLRG